MAYSNFFHIKENEDGVELRFLKTIIDNIDCVINKNTVAREKYENTYWDNRHDEVPTIDKHFNIENSDVLYVSKVERYDYESGFINNGSLVIVVYKQGKSAEIIYCEKRLFSPLKDIVLDTFCIFKDGKMIPLDESMFIADKPNIKDVYLNIGYLYNRVHKEDVHRYTCETSLNQAEEIYRKMFAGISNRCI
jgi:hypothetical protein|nr:MAG TPA: hypothetical protein [Bacteriophage sp.]